MRIKYLLNGVAIAAALAIAAPVWAQDNPSAGNGMEMPGPNAGGGGLLTPYRGGGYPLTAATLAPASTSASLPVHHAVRHAKAMRARHKAMSQEAAVTGDTAAQLNREELARIQSPDAFAPPPPALLSPPPAPTAAAPMLPEPNPSGGNSMGVPGPNPGGPGLTPYTD